jgi:hypothetical protein
VNASNPYDGSGLGTGCGDDGGVSAIDELTIWNSSAVVTSLSRGSGIGSGDILSRGHSQINALTIFNSRVTARGAAGFAAIGSGATGTEVNLIQFTGDCFIECDGSGINQTINASSITFSAASITFVTNDTRLFGMSPSSQGWFDLMIGYRQVTRKGAEPLSSLPGPFLHIGNLSLPSSELKSFELCLRRNGFERGFGEASDRIRSVIVGNGSGTYSFPGWIDGARGHFADSDGKIDFAVDSHDSFIDILWFIISPSCQFHATGMLYTNLMPDGTSIIASPSLTLSAAPGTIGALQSLSLHLSSALVQSGAFVSELFSFGTGAVDPSGKMDFSQYCSQTGRFEGSLALQGVRQSEYFAPSQDFSSSALLDPTHPHSMPNRFPGRRGDRNLVELIA